MANHFIKSRLASLAERKKQEENAAVVVFAIRKQLDELRTKIIAEQLLLDAILEKLLRFLHKHDSEYPQSSESLDTTDITELLEKVVSGEEFPQELKDLVKQYQAVQQQMHSLEQDIYALDTELQEQEKELQTYQQQNQELEKTIKEQEQKHEELTQKVVEHIHQELSQLSNAPSKQDVKDAFSQDVTEQQLEQLHPERRNALIQALRQEPHFMPAFISETIEISNKDILRLVPNTARAAVLFIELDVIGLVLGLDRSVHNMTQFKAKADDLQENMKEIHDSIAQSQTKMYELSNKYNKLTAEEKKLKTELQEYQVKMQQQETSGIKKK